MSFVESLVRSESWRFIYSIFINEVKFVSKESLIGFLCSQQWCHVVEFHGLCSVVASFYSVGDLWLRLPMWLVQKEIVIRIFKMLKEPQVWETRIVGIFMFF